MTRIIITTCLIVMGGLFSAFSVLAMTISPPVEEFTADPGAAKKGVVKLYNDEDAARTLYASIQPFTARGEKGEPGFSDAKIDDYALAGWIHLERTEVVLEPGQRAEIPYVISIPSFAEAGGHYAAIFWSTQPPNLEGTGVAIAGKIGSLVLLRVRGEIIERGELLEFALKEKKKFYSHLPIDFLVRFENTGNVHLKPFGKIAIRDMFNPVRKNISNGTSKEAGGALVNAAANAEGAEIPVGNILPQSKRMFEASWVKNKAVESPRTFLEKVKYEKENYAFGKYKGILNLEYGSPEQKIQKEVVFWIFPWHLILTYGGGIIFSILLIVFGLKRYNRWIVGRG